MHSDKSLYSLEEAAEFAKCKPADLLRYAAQKKIKLLVGVPDWVDVRVYDETTNTDIEPFLMAPELLVLSQSHCLKIEINGRTEQSDFLEGYLTGASGELVSIRPNYGYPGLNHRWIYWRTFRDRLVNLLELIPGRLFVLHSSLTWMTEPKVEPVDEKIIQPKKRKEAKQEKQETDGAGDQKDLSDIDNDSGNVADQGQGDELPQNAPVEHSLKDQSTDSTELLKKSVSILRLKQVITQTGLSRSTIYDKMNNNSARFDPTFPKQVNLGTGSVGWLESEVVDWIKSRITSSRNKA